MRVHDAARRGDGVAAQRQLVDRRVCNNARAAERAATSIARTRTRARAARQTGGAVGGRAGGGRLRAEAAALDRRKVLLNFLVAQLMRARA